MVGAGKEKLGTKFDDQRSSNLNTNDNVDFWRKKLRKQPRLR